MPQPLFEIDAYSDHAGYLDQRPPERASIHLRRKEDTKKSFRLSLVLK